MVSLFDFRSEGRWFEPGLCRRVVFPPLCLCPSRCKHGLPPGDHNAGREPCDGLESHSGAG